MANRRNLQNKINQKLKGDAKAEALDNLENNDIELVQEQLQTKRNTTIGTEFIKESIGGFKPLEIVESFKGQVIQGEGACEIIPEKAFSTESLIDPKTETLTAGTINFTNNFATIVDGTGLTPTATITGGDSDQPIADIVGDLTGMPSLKTEAKKFGMNLVGAGSPEGLKAAFEKGQDLLGKTNDALSLAHNAAGGLKFVKNNLGDAAKGKAMEAALGAISGLPDLNKVIPNPEDLADNIENVTGNKELTMKTKVAKAKLAKFAKIAAIVGTVAAFKDDIKGFVDKAKSFVSKKLGAIATGLIVGGIIQEVSEKVNQGLKNKVTENLGTELPAKVQEEVNKKVVEGDTEGVVEKIKETTGLKEQSDIERLDKLAKELNPTISGSLVKDADFYGQPTQLGDNISKWAGERTSDEAFTYVSSVEELNSEMMSISRPISEVIIHGSETQSNKNIGSIEINNVHKQLGHDGIVYHYVIRRDGRLQRGRPADRESEHTSSHNKFSLAVCLVGGINLPTGDVNPLDNRSESAFTREQFTTLERFLEAFFMKVPGGLVFGHNELESDVDDPYFSVMDYVEKNFRKSYDRVANSFKFTELDPTDTTINS